MKYIFTTIRNIVLYLWPVFGTVRLERLANKPGNEMWRIGRGYNNSRPFFRIDWKNRGWRWTWAKD